MRAEIDIERDVPRAGGDQSVDDLGVISARPRPAIEFLKAPAVDLHDDEFLACLAFEKPEGHIRQRMIERCEEPANISACNGGKDDQMW